MRDVLIKVGMTAAAMSFSEDENPLHQLTVVFAKRPAPKKSVVFRRRLHQLTGRNVRSAVSS
jgi:hypothetical protein